MDSLQIFLNVCYLLAVIILVMINSLSIKMIRHLKTMQKLDSQIIKIQDSQIKTLKMLNDAQEELIKIQSK